STAPGRTQPEIPWADCSGLIVKAWTRLRERFPTLPEIGGTVSTSIELWAVANGGRYITRDEALVTPACCLAVWGIGSKGHITFGVGDGQREFGTPSDEGHLVGFSRFDATHQRNRYDRFFTLPGIDHLGIHRPQRPRRRQHMFDILTAATGAKAGHPVHVLVQSAGAEVGATWINDQQVYDLVQQPLPPNRFEGDITQINQILRGLHL